MSEDNFTNIEINQQIHSTKSINGSHRSINRNKVSSINKERSIFFKFQKYYNKNKYKFNTTFTVFLFFFDIYKIIIGSFLTIFTYQSCDLINEKLKCFDHPYEWFALSWNVLTFVLCFVQLGYQIHRESYFLRELLSTDQEEDIIKLMFVTKNSQTSYVSTSVIDMIKPYKNIEEFYQLQNSEEDDSNKFDKDKYDNIILDQIDYFNEKYALCVKMSTVSFLFNILFSGISIFYYSFLTTTLEESTTLLNQNKLKTTTTFLSNTLLLGLHIYKGIIVVKEYYNNDKTIAISSYTQKYINYNNVNVFSSWHKNK